MKPSMMELLDPSYCPELDDQPRRTRFRSRIALIIALIRLAKKGN